MGGPISYRCGIGYLFAKQFGGTPCDPHIVCDWCGATRDIATRHAFVARWFLEGKAAPKWAGGRQDDGTRLDMCPSCVERICAEHKTEIALATEREKKET